MASAVALKTGLERLEANRFDDWAKEHMIREMPQTFCRPWLRESWPVGAGISGAEDGTIWAKGPMIDGVMTGYWKWFRKDGTVMRSGYFENGDQVGEWTTYDKNGKVIKVTTIKPRKPK